MSETTKTVEQTMAEKLVAAGEQAVTETKRRRAKEVQGSHLLETMSARATALGLTVEELSGFLKITGNSKGKKIYLDRKGGRCDLSGFTVQAEAITQISAEDAKKKHLGRVQGQVDFSRDDALVLAAFDSALTELGGPVQSDEVQTESKTEAA